MQREQVRDLDVDVEALRVRARRRRSRTARSRRRSRSRTAPRPRPSSSAAARSISMPLKWPTSSVASAASATPGSSEPQRAPEDSASRCRAAGARRRRASDQHAGGRPAPPRIVCGEGVERGAVGEHRRRSTSARAWPLPVDLVADRVLHPRVGGEDEVGRQRRAERDHPDAREVQPAARACPGRRSTARGRSTRGRTRRAPPSPAARRRCRRRSASSWTSSSRTGTPGRCR